MPHAQVMVRTVRVEGPACPFSGWAQGWCISSSHHPYEVGVMICILCAKNPKLREVEELA